MTIQDLAKELARNAETFRAIVAGIPDDRLGWRPAPGKWSILEILAHLADGEREDFRTRLDHSLHAPGERWPPIDPEGWVGARRYSERPGEEVLSDFLGERARSVAWLDGLPEPDPFRPCDGSGERKLRVGDLIAAWAAHDLFHLRQIVQLRYECLRGSVAPFTPDYAGPW